MDIKKDIQGQAKNQGQTLGIQKGRSLVSSNGMESFTVSLGKRSERLATALYLVTSFLSDIEPLKSRLRTLSLDLVRDASIVRYGSISVETNTLETLRANIGETLGLLELAFIVGLVSEMNFSVLKREYGALRDAIEVKKASRESRTDSILGDTFFGSSFEPAPRTQGLTLRNLGPRSDLNEPAQHIPIGHSKGQNNINMSDKKVAPAPSVFASEAKQPSAPAFRAPSIVTGEMSSVQKNARRARILKLIKDNREVTIKDISTHFPELSEKTIQRELVSLTEAGVLKKFGERRWSRYTLA